MRIGGQQPYFLPDFFYFLKIFHSNIFLLADFLRFRKQSPMVRCRLTQKRRQYLTIPVQHPHPPQPPLYQVRIMPLSAWRHQHLRTLRSLFAQTPFFDFYFPQLEEIYHRSWDLLSDMLTAIIRWQVGLLFPEKELRSAIQAGIHTNRDLERWLWQYPNPEFQIFPREAPYYSSHFPKIPAKEILPPDATEFPPEYAPEMPLMILLFLKGPETIRYFR